MAAPEIKFFPGLASAGGFGAINALAGSGFGFYGLAGFGAPVQVNAWQTRTFVTDATGTIQGPECNNITYLNAASGIIGSAGPTGSGTHLLRIPNYQATVKIQFLNDTAVKTQNQRLTIYDRISPTHAPTGVTCKVAELIHPSMLQTDIGSGSATWFTFNYTTGGVYLALTPSPGSGGLSPNGANTTDTIHEWFVALSASPDSIGAKTMFGLYMSLEYL
jgi:hypothetical protein